MIYRTKDAVHFIVDVHKKKLWLNNLQEFTMPQKQKMPRIIYDPEPLNCIGREEWEMPGWITPEIPRGFFNTTNRTVYSVEEDVEDKDENSEPNIIRDGEGSETKKTHRMRRRTTTIWSSWGSTRRKMMMRRMMTKSKS